ncbi:LacI family DNA-binding transcriptional regulator [Rhodococcus sp. BP-252]|uniref:LacI family DNA-binding transcriptional regulator n=1 Tax=unclassified Rhodococcus (in: high G+C Gram-positive bacteria) TaxID=192944 RepID=UPI001430A6F5|nr:MULTISPECIES: LacI family DNA-binding transcriptional regulator [unclassified Rhodococcus (in: high G+C Gram-positive bacteria)]MBY6411882.1 LacI family DNA-binding transcriptional regulator [Rhodococcus sp. BP-320]MBY6416490.1 LacI family DNA-binding transcriptional regulator [Rhodococcus sp. BP-321]MBY6420704.1 LacI family DNA-binding transcriptional regulator [Rhodococcus sp. BP-324]MBY6426514.1 LacI family DNA-binding transcriptional regulator [Rhodococcus sp. BP-323]MBY6431513.1 LacI f
MSTRPTMADVARAAGVSTMSVSYTYNQPGRVSGSTRDRVLAAASELGYTGPHRAASSLRSGKTNNLGVVLTEKLTYSFENPEARAFLSGIAEACLDTDTGLVLLPNSRIGVDLDRIRDAHVDGFVLWTTVADDPVLDIITATGKPACIQGGPRHPGIEFIGIDDASAAHAIGTIGLFGARRPAIISFPCDRERIAETVLGPEPENATFPVTAARLAGYRRAVVEYGLGWEQIPVAFVPTNARAEGAVAARTLLDDYRADAILCTSDDLALGVLDAGASGVAVTGWDDSEAAGAAGLTTVAQSLYDQGRNAARWVLGSLSTLPQAEWSVVVRGSTR